MMVRRLWQVVSWIALAATILPAILFMEETIDLDRLKVIMLVATVVWFIATPLWMGRETSASKRKG